MKSNYFRAWDEKEKLMMDGDFIEENHPIYTAGMSYGKLFVANHSDGEWYDCEVMQATGRYDKNGKQVFEGDILATPHFLDVNGWRYLHHIVEWSDKFSGWWCRNVTSDHDDDGNIQLWVYAKKEFEVVGNIYQRPEIPFNGSSITGHRPSACGGYTTKGGLMSEEEIYDMIHQEMSNHYFEMHKYGREQELRDQFAAHVLTGMAKGYRSATGCDSENMKKVMALDCKIAYALADAMLVARRQDETR